MKKQQEDRVADIDQGLLKCILKLGCRTLVMVWEKRVLDNSILSIAGKPVAERGAAHSPEAPAYNHHLKIRLRPQVTVY